MKKPYRIKQLKPREDGKTHSQPYYWAKIGANGEYMNDSLPETFKTRQGARRAMIQSINVDVRFYTEQYQYGIEPVPYKHWSLWAIDETAKGRIKK